MPTPIEVHCPNCQATLKLKNTKAVGKRVPCPKCQTPFVIELPQAEPVEEEMEVLDEFDDLDDFGDLEEEAPAAASPPAAKKSGRLWAIIGGSVAGVAVIGVLVWLLFFNDGGEQQPPVAQNNPPPVPGEPDKAPEEPKANEPVNVGTNQPLDTHWLPPKSVVVISAEVAKILAAPLTQAVIKHPELAGDMTKFFQQIREESVIGVEDVEKVVMGISAPDVVTQALSGGLDPQKLAANLQMNSVAALVITLKAPLTPEQTVKLDGKLKKKMIAGKSVYQLPQRGAPSEPEAFLYLAAEKVLVISIESFVAELIQNGDPYTPRPDLAFVDGGQDLVIAVALPEPITIPLPPEIATSPQAADPTFASLLKLNGKVNGLSFGIGVSDGLGLKLQGLTIDEASGAIAKALLEGGLALGKQQMDQTIKQSPAAAVLLGPFQSVLNDAKVTQSGPEFGFAANLALDTPLINPAMLAGMAVPAIMFAREAARQSACRNNLVQIGLAALNYRTAKGSLPPPAIIAANGKPLLSWRVALLPYLGEQDLFEKFNLNEPWDSPTNKALITEIPELYACPSGDLKDGQTTYRLVTVGRCAYANGKPVDGPELNKRGGGGTVPLVVDAKDSYAVAWTNPASFDGSLGVVGHHESGSNVLFADGHVDFRSDADDLASGGADPGDDGSKDQQKIQGRWKVVTATYGGKTQDSFVNQQFTFSGNKISQVTRPGAQPLASTFRLTPTTNPRSFDWIQQGNKTFLGLYQLRGQALKLTVALPGQARPQTLAGGPTGLVLTLQRDGPSPSVPSVPATGTNTPVTTKGSPSPDKPDVLKKSDNPTYARREDNLKRSIQRNAEKEFPDKKGLKLVFRGFEHQEKVTFVELSLETAVLEKVRLIHMFSYEQESSPKHVGTYQFKNGKFRLTVTAKGISDLPKTHIEIKPVPKVPKKSGEDIAGTWRVESATVGGNASAALKGRILAFSEEKASLNVTKLDMISYRFDYEVNTKAKPFTFVVLNADRLVLHGVFKHEGGKLHLCFSRATIAAPRNFIAKTPGHTLYILVPVKAP